MEIGYLTKRLDPTVIVLIVVTVAVTVALRSIIREAGYRENGSHTVGDIWLADCLT